MSHLRFAVRALLRTPVVTLPVHEPERLVNLISRGPRSGTVSCGAAGTCDEIFSYPMFRDLERVRTVFTGIAAHRDFAASISHDGSSERGDAALVSGSYFPLLGLSPAAGRLLRPDDEREQAASNHRSLNRTNLQPSRRSE